MSAADLEKVRRYGPPRVSDLLDRAALNTPDAEALVIDERRISYAELKKEVDATACALLAAGVGKGDRVAAMTPPHPDYFVTFLATASIGAIWLGLNPRYREEELKYVVGDAEPAILFARLRIGERDYSREIEAMRMAAASIRRVVLFDAEEPIGDCEPFRDFVDRVGGVDSAALQAARLACGGRDPCLLVYTSGSTGRPKGALLHHEGIVEFSLAQNRVWPVREQRFLNYFPINHVGCVLDVSCPTLAAGGCIVFMEQFTPEGSLRLMERERITAWASVPSTFQMQLALPDFDSYDLSAIELIIWEGAAMPVELIEQLARRGPPLATNYSMTEAAGITIVAPTHDLDVLSNTVGVAFDGVQIRLVDGNGRVVRQGETGEIQVKSLFNMLGYWRRPEATKDTLLAGGWLRTGDLGVLREDGRLRIVGRLKEMFKSGGYNVYPREVEDAIELHPKVALAAVVSQSDQVWQEVGVAYVIPKEPLTVAELERHCRERLANYKIPKRFVIRDELPLLPIGKVDKVTLKRWAEEFATTAEGG